MQSVPNTTNVASSNPLRRGVLDTTLYEQVCQWLGTAQWFSLGTPVSSTNKTDFQDITEILLKPICIFLKQLAVWYRKGHFIISDLCINKLKNWKLRIHYNFFTVFEKWGLSCIQLQVHVNVPESENTEKNSFECQL